MTRPILTLKPVLTVDPDFLAKLDQALEEIEAGKTVTFNSEAESLAFLTRVRALGDEADRMDTIRLTGLSEAELYRELWGDQR